MQFEMLRESIKYLCERLRAQGCDVKYRPTALTVGVVHYFGGQENISVFVKGIDIDLEPMRELRDFLCKQMRVLA